MATIPNCGIAIGTHVGWIHAGHEAGTAGCANRAAAIRVGEGDAVLGNAIQVGGFDNGMASVSCIPKCVLVRTNEYDVWTCVGCCGHRVTPLMKFIKICILLTVDPVPTLSLFF